MKRPMNSTVVAVLLWALAVALLLVIFLAALRFFTVRSRGTSVLLRRVPAKNSLSWRHGSLRYEGEFVEYFKLRSVSPRCDLRINRLDIEVMSTRPLDDDEASFMSAATEVIRFRAKGKEYELASDAHGIMAFGAWVEAAPSKRQQRFDFRELRERATRQSKR